MSLYTQLAASARHDAHVWRQMVNTFPETTWRERCECEARKRYHAAIEYLRDERKLREKLQ